MEGLVIGVQFHQIWKNSKLKLCYTVATSLISCTSSTEEIKPSADGLENNTPNVPSCSNPPTSESIPVRQPTPTINGGVPEGGGIHINGCQNITVNYYTERKIDFFVLYWVTTHTMYCDL